MIKKKTFFQDQDQDKDCFLKTYRAALNVLRY